MWLERLRFLANLSDQSSFRLISLALIVIIIILTETPKSGEVELHIAPILAAANMASTASQQLEI